MGSCGIDFGTSNSAVSIKTSDGFDLVELEQGYNTTPSALYYPFDGGDMLLGRQAVDEYVAYGEGRLLRGLKSLLGSATYDMQTRAGRKVIKFNEAIGHVISYLKNSAETEIMHDIDSVVLGRPVQFVGSGDAINETALSRLTSIANEAGFKHVEFQYEPIAAALSYERTINKEQIVLVVDIGGGTSDFSVIKCRPDANNNQNRKDDVLANWGVRIGGTNLDVQLNLISAMKLLGYESKLKSDFGNTVTEVPPSLFIDLSTWHKIIFAYDPKNIRLAQDLLRQSLDKPLLQRLVDVMEERLAHQICATVETAKIGLSDIDTASLDLGFIETHLNTSVTRDAFEACVEDIMDKISNALNEVTTAANINADQIDTIMLTGGASNTPVLIKTVSAVFPNANLVKHRSMDAVAQGLGIHAGRVFG